MPPLSGTTLLSFPEYIDKISKKIGNKYSCNYLIFKLFLSYFFLVEWKLFVLS